MITATTLNQIETAFLNIQISLSGILKTFYMGDIDRFKKTDVIYPVLYVHIDDCNIGQTFTEYTCNVVCLDRMNKDLSNENEVYSDTLKYLTWVKAYLINQNQNIFPFVINTDSQAFKVKHSTNSDFASGWNMQLKIKAKNDVCNIPLN